MMRTRIRVAALFAALAIFVGCHRGHDDSANSSGSETGSSAPTARGSSRAELCTDTGDQFIQMPYDTNGDGAADVIRVFRIMPNSASSDGASNSRRIVCREADLNSDGVRDVMRVYDDQGRVAREQQDRDFDGRPDYWEYYENGRLIRTDEDANRDGRVDTRVFLDLQGRPDRIERDVAARSVSGIWRPDHFEFFTDGRLTRSGEDTNLDGAVDRWDRDRIYEAEREARERAASGDTSDTDSATADAAVPDGGASDAGVRDAGVRDAGASDAGVRDAGVRDASVNDAGRPATNAPR